MTNSNPFVRTIVKYQDILDALIQKTNENWVNYRSNSIGHIVIREYRTVGLFVGRQCGSTTALIEFANRHPGECLAVFVEDKIKQAVLAKFQNAKDNIVSCLITHQLRKYIHQPEESSIQKDIKEELISSVKYILVDNASFNLNLRGITDKEFNQWVADTFGTEVMVVRFS
ncbi:hypothetical protein FDJ06_gp014 [Pseudomonas phage SL2]|uniref:PHIKZ297 n=4 Tax=root TaxID=1 RepID=Q8SCL5_BPDPK|nr:hypothetical protein [Pseudomonas aeruginosa]NP_803863.1 PHIKZ297 [Pseudomonas phage phiKZ]YP_009619554.1 hypothetical protein FDJ06_gp014 [Pseudomonas phage SL2]QXN68722.1 hypothetical protein [Pseudomonas phage PA7]UNI71884.1 hypothetical protein Churi01_gp360 [Pseudomonas phage Churi01]UXD83694.1 hypothetical protein NP274_00292 [Pseudomonas phage Koomba boorn-mokiny kep-wari Wadjak 2]WNV48023.1 hypothetical protein [Pseudomonas phage fMGyn-Pae01]WNV50361.1 hypothetical protein [Pseudo